MAAHQEKTVINWFDLDDADEYAAEYDNGETKFPDKLAIGMGQLFRFQQFLGWQPVGDPELTVKPMELRGGVFADMSMDVGFLRLVKTS